MQQNLESQENEILMKSPNQKNDIEESKKEIIIEDKQIDEQQIQPAAPKSKLPLIIFSIVSISLAVAIGIIVWQTTKQDGQLSRQCYYINSTYCIRCKIGQVLLKNQTCGQNCEYNQYNNNGLCMECSQTCNGCYGLGNNCTECRSLDYSINTFNYNKTNNIQICQCNEGFFMDNTDNYNCNACSEICKQCDGPDSCLDCNDGYYLNQTQCIKNPINIQYASMNTINNRLQIIKCNKPFFLHKNNCIKQCPIGYGNNIQDYTCLKCDNCPDSNCDDEKQCIPSCTLGEYLDKNKNDCIQCGENCNKCTSPTKCMKCVPGTFLYNSGCNLTCPNGYYGSPDDKCLICKDPCQTCEYEANHCLSCLNKFYYDPVNFACFKNCENKSGYYQGDNGQFLCIPCADQCLECLAQPQYICKKCTDGSYLDEYQQQCLQCDESCKLCEGQADKCIVCSNDYKYNISNKCYQVCPDHQYGNYALSKCLSCNPTCANCNGKSTNCTSCYDNYYLNNTQCLKCQQPCNNCNGSANNCTQCYANYFLKQNKCIKCDQTCQNCNGISSSSCTSCYNGTYLIKNKCKNCDKSCKTCYGAGNQSCISCQINYYFAYNEQTQIFVCSDVCPDKYYINFYQPYCQKCNQNCYNCSISAKNCTSCDDGQYLNNSKCISCDRSCKTCIGGAIDQCNSCNIDNYYNLSDSTCIKECLLGYYPNNIVFQCVKCNDNCQGCDQSSDQCVSCVDGKYLQNNTCNKCDESCQTCNQGSEFGCLTCSSQLYYNNETKTCRDLCEDGYYANNSTSLQCLKCNDDCQTCNGGLSNNCISCVDGKYKEDTTQECVNCNINCQKCNQSNKCDECDVGYILTPNDFQCQQTS